MKGSLPIPYLKELPDGGVNLVIELNDKTVNTIYPEGNLQKKHEVKRAWISGLQKQAILYKNNTDSTIISVRFTTGGFFCLTKIPITAIDHVGIEAEALLGRSFSHLYERIINASGSSEMFALIENYFLQYRMDHSTEHEIVRFIDENIDKPIDWLIHKSGYSQKHVIHLLKKHAGFSPKYLQRLYRFQLVIKEVQNQQNKIDWFSVVHRYGYYDQAHLIKDFSHFSGISPTDYVNSQAAIAENSLVSDMILKLPS
ncbi:helix-turn-helix domain-containing protein [Chryseolinea soli]|uniref:helix-turn-helix domain-containing protein n=1 Tax=Chryseolinea soli TaxID=2321403 RepID=UPI00135B0DD6|nr:AraC family transcriptional regulator [Chryseolinea soli]